MTKKAKISNGDKPRSPAYIVANNDTFGVFPRDGSIAPEKGQFVGLYYRQMRHLNLVKPKLGNIVWNEPTAEVGPRKLSFSFTNQTGGTVKNPIRVGTVLMTIGYEVLFNGMVVEFTVTNYGARPLTQTLSVDLSAEIEDLFSVREFPRVLKEGETLPETRSDSSLQHVAFRCLELDGFERATEIELSPKATTVALAENKIQPRWKLNLKRGQTETIRLECNFRSEDPGRYFLPEGQTPVELKVASFKVSNRLVQAWITQSVLDGQMVTALTRYGYFPYAGYPLFGCPFGPDALLAAFFWTLVAPDLARGVLELLSAFQGEKEDKVTYQEPGKIFHEFRAGPMANRGEHLFGGPYYGRHDTCGWFLKLLYNYVLLTGDLEFLRRLWPNALAAAQWMVSSGDRNQDGLLEYYSHAAEGGLGNQGWKDSEHFNPEDGPICHADGRSAKGPLSLVEIQAQAFQAFKSMTEMAKWLEQPEVAQQWREKANDLRLIFRQVFWSDKIKTLCLALDGEGKQCEVTTSNAGQCLMTGILSAEDASLVVQSMLTRSMWSGYCIRTLSAAEAAYNPMGYQVGAGWPHDMIIIIMGFCRYGFKKEAAMVLGGLFESCVQSGTLSVPELFCGFDKEFHRVRLPHHQANDLQAWGCTAVLAGLCALLGIEVGTDGSLILNQPYLPDWLGDLEIDNMYIRNKRMHMLFQIPPGGGTPEITEAEDNEVQWKVVS